MNDTNCERCGEAPADKLVEHAQYGEAVCNLCLRDEDRAHDVRDADSGEYIYGEQR